MKVIDDEQTARAIPALERLDGLIDIGPATAQAFERRNEGTFEMRDCGGDRGVSRLGAIPPDRNAGGRDEVAEQGRLARTRGRDDQSEAMLPDPAEGGVEPFSRQAFRLRRPGLRPEHWLPTFLCHRTHPPIRP